MEAGFTKSAATIEKNALNRPKWLSHGSQDSFTQKVPEFFGNFGVPSGSPKITKNRFFPKKAVPGSAFLSIFAPNAVFLDSRLILGESEP